jgi:hypothetical protein
MKTANSEISQTGTQIHPYSFRFHFVYLKNDARSYKLCLNSGQEQKQFKEQGVKD